MILGINTIVPNANNNDPVCTANTEIMHYRRHYYGSNNNTSYYPYELAPSSSSTNYNPDTVIGYNDMDLDADTAVVRITTSGGTGFIIGSNTIATAAHCVYDKSNNTFLNFNIEIVGNNGNTIASFTPKYVHVPVEYINTAGGTNGYDYALIYVEPNNNPDFDLTDYGMFKLGYCLDSFLNDEGGVTVSGFPDSYPPGYNIQGWGTRFKSYGHLFELDYSNLQGEIHRLKYTADALPGMSGGPVYVSESVYMPQYNINKTYKTVIGINTSEGDIFNAGIRINCQHLRFYYENPYI